ncbi:MAG: hypothetical protein BWZ07_01913 [Alphaproteobacteria bacterium ADurb.BinA280]|jgi:hypothetical protein|nr:hypothetical protein [Xanthomonadales bacterium]MCC6504784.1 hypothetical protein [Aquimonas sp.]OPZ11591.1 MAG: hypothetical protein BWZ07_01913 [Alphaproteobacteria bacterium ADurb.BinA280]
MKFLLQILVAVRYLQLRRQTREMLQIVAQLPNSTRSAVATLTMSEIENAARAPVPHLHGSEQLDRYQPWGDASAAAFAKARSSITQLKLRGIALWIAVIYHETRESPREGMRQVHRDVLGMIATLKAAPVGTARPAWHRHAKQNL